MSGIHGVILQHIWDDDEEVDHAPPDVDLIELGDVPKDVPSSYCDIFQRNVVLPVLCLSISVFNVNQTSLNAWVVLFLISCLLS